jgi:hypothetical protein
LLVSALAPPTIETTEAWSASPFAGFLAPTATAPLAAESKDDGSHPDLLSYTYVEVGAAKYNLDDAGDDDEVDIYYGRGSLSLLSFLYLFGEYSNQSSDFGNTDTDPIVLGAGAHFGVQPNVSLYGELGVLFNDVSSDIDEIDDSETGYRLLGGARWLALPFTEGGVELDGHLGNLSVDNRLGSDDDPFLWGVGVRVHFIRFLSVGIGYDMVGDDDQLSGNVRFSF